MYIYKLNKMRHATLCMLMSSHARRTKKYNRINDNPSNDPQYPANIDFYSRIKQPEMFPLTRKHRKKK